MKKTIASFTLAALSVCLGSCTHAPTVFPATPESLLGTWHSNHDVSMRYLRANSIHDQKTEHMLDQMMGRENMVFTPDRVTIELPAWHIVEEGLSRNLAGGRFDSGYSVVAAKDGVVTISVANRFSIAPSVYHFEDKDTFWIEQEDSLEYQAPGFRDYFTRVP